MTEQVHAFEEMPPPDRTWTDHPLFHTMSPEAMISVARHITLRRYSAGSTIIFQGDTATHLFVVARGEVQIRRELDGQDIVIDTIRRGDIFGETGLLTDYRRTATVVALTAVEVYALSREGFDLLIGQNFALANQLVQIHNARSLALERASTPLQATGSPPRVTGPISEPPPRVTGPISEPPPFVPLTAQILTVFSPAGGTGKTMLACNLAVLLARKMPRRVALVDLSVLASQCALLLNVGGKRSVAAYIAGGSVGDLSGFDAPTWRKELMGEHESGLAVLSLAHTALEAVALTRETVETVLEGISKAFPVVVVDTTSVYSDVNLAALAKATRLLLVSSYELTSLRGMMECVTALEDPDQPLQDRAAFILNGTRARPPIRVQEFSARVKLPVVCQLPFGEDLPSVAARNGTALVDMKAQSALARELSALADRLVSSSSTAARR